MNDLPIKMRNIDRYGSYEPMTSIKKYPTGYTRGNGIVTDIVKMALPVVVPAVADYAMSKIFKKGKGVILDYYDDTPQVATKEVAPCVENDKSFWCKKRGGRRVRELPVPILAPDAVMGQGLEMSPEMMERVRKTEGYSLRMGKGSKPASEMTGSDFGNLSQFQQLTQQIRDEDARNRAIWSGNPQGFSAITDILLKKQQGGSSKPRQHYTSNK